MATALTVRSSMALGRRSRTRRSLIDTTSHHASSLMFDFEGEEECISLATARAQETAFNSSLRERLRYLTAPCGDFATKLSRDVKLYKRVVMREEECNDSVILAAKLIGIGYTVSVKRGLGASSSIFRNLKHEFLCVRGDGDYDGVEYIVDPDFQEQFQIPHPTQQYLEVLKMIPAVFVGTTSRLIPLVQLVAAEMAASFRERGLTLPPWRHVQSMLSKWLPTRAQEVTLGGAGSTPTSSIQFMTVPLASMQSQHSVPQQQHQQQHQQHQQQPSSSSNGAPAQPGIPITARGFHRSASSPGSSAGSSTGSKGRSLLSSQIAGNGALPAGISIIAPQYSGQPATYKVKVGAATQQ